MRPFVLLTLLALTLGAAPVRWVGDYETAFAQARAAHKPLMLFLSRPDCRSCTYMREAVFTDNAVQAYVNARFIAAELPIRDPGLPEKYRVEVSPVFTFIDPAEDEIVEQIIGGKKAMPFLKMLQDIIADNPQFR